MKPKGLGDTLERFTTMKKGDM